MQLIKRHLKEKYQLTNYQIAQLGYLYKTVFSEISKLLIMGFLFHAYLTEYLFSIAVMLILRCLTGGLHFDTYLTCLTGSIVLMGLAVIFLPPLISHLPLKSLFLLFCLLIINSIGPIVSKYRPSYSKEHLTYCKRIVLCFIFIYSLLVYVMPDTHLLNVGTGVILLHTLQLIAAKIQRKGENAK